ncbi:GNAT family N-acetyltransferase [Stackebrandtia nassauensis]|uniref:GCN5-related N-acetyltransferase n=1 Tax=Stackebrandtia nassauensis (strain DSM 44728 / CIP 108903 / NRRL B-16338 / NBRC 102104 / LLR-40K-21) TaxID=446470 RepID=D3Q1F1_STANL|nr:GNAT family N-acetyltransferase [Stackebrandtia nassauensis]ADD45731.1 GCN5-related N-acetyltransferase [Stackebrandtia nassauensis DSM 44728]
MTDIEITVLDPLEPDDVDGAMETAELSIREDVPDFPALSRAEFIVRMTRRSKSHRKHRLIAKVDGTVVGYASLHIPLLENRHLIEFELEVRPDHRRRGIGSALLAEIERYARADDRTTLLVYIPDTIDGRPQLPHNGQHFAAKQGFEKKSQEIRRAADLTEVDDAALDELLAKSWTKAEGYELIQWINDSPDDVVEALAYLDSRLVTDSPMGDLNFEAPKTDVARIRERESDGRTAGILRIATALRHKESGTVAGWTDIVVDPGDEDNCWQGITIVDPDHRGHRLGTILKIENHRHVLRYRPRMRYVTTWNAEANDFMININEAVGYRARERWLALEKDLK